MTTTAQQKPDRVIKITRKTAKFWKEQLARNTPNNERPYGEPMDEVAKTFSIAGTKYEVVLQLVNSEPDRAREAEGGGGLGEPPGGPYLNAVLYADGSEQCVLPPDRYELEGRFEFRDSVEGRDIVVEIKAPEIKKHVITKGLHRTEWWIENRTEVHVNVYKTKGANKEKPILEWVYGKIPGNNILGNAAIWFDQAILQAEAEKGKTNTKEDQADATA